MNLTAFIPWPYRILALLALSAALTGFGYVKGLQHAADAAAKTDNRALQTVIKIERKQTAITVSAAAAHEEVRAAARIVYRTIDREVIKYVQTATPSARCQLDAGWVRLHDAAALALVPGAPSESDATPGGITAAEGIATVSNNYETCNDTRTQLIDLQGWVRKQGAAWIQ